MPDPGCVSGFIGVGIDRAIQQILDHINIAVRCRKEMASLKDLVMKIKPIVNEIQLYRAAINRKGKDKASAVNGWLKRLDALLQQASKMVQRCTIPTCNVISRYQTSIRISSLISEINEHVKLSPLVELAHISELLEEQTLKLQDDLEQIKEGIEALGPSSTSRGALPSISSANMTLIEEPLIVGQQKTFSILEKLVIDEVEANSIGVLGKGGSGKTLLLKTLFNSPKVRKHFSEGLFLWLTFSQSPCVTTLTNALRTQIATQQNVNLGEIMNGEEGKLWVNQTLRQSNRFVLFLDDVWGENAAELLEELGVTRPLRYHGNSKVIVCSRDRSALLKIGVADKYTITMEDLMEDESWKLFAYHAFPYNNGNLAANIDEEKAKLVCRKCAGLPLAIKVVGRALAGSTHSQQWEWALRSLPKANTLYDCLRLSYDALGKEGVHLQLCFLYLATIGIEDGIFHAQDAIQVWLAEGLLAKEIPKDEHELYDPFELGSFYVNLLADRCLIEAMITDFDGQVLYFRVHDLMRDLAILIAEEEENFHCRVGKGLTYLNENEFSSCVRLLLGHNKLCYFPPLTSCPQISTLSLTGNAYLTKFPGRVMKSMISLKLLSLSGTSVKSLSKTVGRLQQLVYLSLVDMPINKLPASLTNLINLEILVLSRSSITELPCDIYMLRSLRKLDIRGCKDLQYLPQSISRLTSLQRLETYGCPLLWNNCKYKGNKKYACINTLGSLTQLKRLQLENNGQTITDGTLGKMTEMNFLTLSLTKMETLPGDMSNMSKLKRLTLLDCSQLIRLNNNFCAFQKLGRLTFWKCDMLEELPYLHMLRSLRQLEIIRCSRLKKFPIEFGDAGAFCSLEIFSLVWLSVLEELPVIQEGGMPSLQIFTLMGCQLLKILPKSYLNLKKLQKIRIYGCSVEILDTIEKTNIVKVVTMSIKDMEEAAMRYFQLFLRRESWQYGEFWCNELFLFLRSITTYV